ncbi:arginyl-tRNA synthetase [Colletotrichum tofieldiae]|uniref:Arginyl-tRNA synthetase n=1 Tax=Colletotrichum tofieldiae TaxID=708197 RepID=A0A166W6Y1_9PEZI|nr:arginyl-tRNA synthetase [Colletotrichum tofieldiae]GKT93844.1 arginyl-tRNA synthetase [Colletotrichum tofieldiae]
MANRRDRGTTVITPEERTRRVQEAKNNIRESATYTPALLGRIESRIDANAFRRCISDNTIYQSLCNSLKDKNIPERERRPDLVDFLALEAIVPVNYDGEYNRVLKDLFIRCHTEAWVDKAVLEANHEWYQDALNAARNFVKTLISKVDSQLLEIILEDIETSFWREKLTDHALYRRVLDKVSTSQILTQRDVLTVVALNGGKYPTEIFRHLVINQNSNMLNWGNNIKAQHALYEDDEFQDVRAGSTIYSETMANLESFADAMQNKQKSHEIHKKIREMKELMKDDLGILRHTQGGRVQKATSGGYGQRARMGSSVSRSRHDSVASSSSGLFMRQESGGYEEYHDGGQGELDGADGFASNGGGGDRGGAYVKREKPGPAADQFLSYSF